MSSFHFRLKGKVGFIFPSPKSEDMGNPHAKQKPKKEEAKSIVEKVSRIV